MRNPMLKCKCQADKTENIKLAEYITQQMLPLKVTVVICLFPSIALFKWTFYISAVIEKFEFTFAYKIKCAHV